MIEALKTILKFEKESLDRKMPKNQFHRQLAKSQTVVKILSCINHNKFGKEVTSTIKGF